MPSRFGRRLGRERLLEAPELPSRDPILTFVGDHRALGKRTYQDATPMLGWSGADTVMFFARASS
jgi:hypothetical protein